MKSQEFYNELKHLTELGYLEQTQLDRIRAEYITNRKEHRNIYLIFALLGVVFIGAGVISLFAYNWSMLSREMKAFIALIPLLAVQGVLYWKTRANASDVWIKSLTLALGIAFLSALGLIYQAYQISFSLDSMMLTGFLLMLPVVYLLDGYYLAVLYLAGVCWTGWNSDYTLLVLLLLPYYRKRIKAGENCGMLSLCFFIWFLYLAVLYIPYGTYYACILILLIYMTIGNPDLFSKLAGRLLYGMLFFKAVLYAFFNSFAGIFESGDWDRYDGRLPEILLLALLAAVLVRIYIFCKKSTASGRSGLLISCIICGLLVTDRILFSYHHMFAYEVLVNLSFIAISLYRLLRGFKQSNPASVRRYTAAVILYIIWKVSLGNYQLVVKGIVFLIAGLAFLMTNYRMSLSGGTAIKKNHGKTDKGVNTHEDTSIHEDTPE